MKGLNLWLVLQVIGFTMKKGCFENKSKQPLII